MSHGLFYRCIYYISGPGNISVVLLSMEDQRALRFHQKHLNLCSEDERRSYGFGTTWGWVIHDIILILGWTNPLRVKIPQKFHMALVATAEKKHNTSKDSEVSAHITSQHPRAGYMLHKQRSTKERTYQSQVCVRWSMRLMVACGIGLSG